MLYFEAHDKENEMIHTIKVKELVPNSAATHSDGEIIYQIIFPLLQAGEMVCIDLEDCLCGLAFIDDAFCPLLDRMSFDHIKKYLTFVHTTSPTFKYIDEQMNKYLAAITAPE